MKLYGHPLSSCTRKVLLLLAEKGAADRAELAVVDLFAHAQRAPAHLARHPFGVVPVLEDDDGFVLYESRAILRYLDAKLDGPRLTPDDPRARARMDQWLSVDQSYVGPHTRALAIERVLKPRENKPADAGAIDIAESALSRALGVVDEALAGGGGPFLTGEAFTLADISLLPYVASLSLIGAERLLASWAHVVAWWERCRARPAWRATERLGAA